jgi:nucleoside-diphosphate-sugar epimerase
MLELVRGDFCRLNVLLPDSQATDPLGAVARPFTMRAEWSGQSTLVGYKAFREEFDDWVRAIRSGSPPLLSGRSVLPVVAAIERCYEIRRPLEESWAVTPAVGAWTRADGAPAIANARPRVLVTGAGGFLGGRTVELLLASGRWDVRPMVRRPASAARLARWPLEVIVGDVTSSDDLADAMAGCDAVVHCAVGTTWPPETAFKTTVEGTRAAAEAALRAGVRRFVHVSSMAVHGDRPPLVLDESQPFQPGTGFGYTRAKCLAEEAVQQARARGLGAICLRPARIYGPFSKTFTVRPLAALASGVLALAGDADTTSNMVYVDNVVDAILRALDAPSRLDGEAFLITEPEQLSWRRFYEFFAASTGATIDIRPSPVPSAANAPGFLQSLARGAREIAFSPEVRALAKKVLSTDPYGTWPRKVWDRSPKLQQRVLTMMGVDSAVIYREPPPAGTLEVVFRIDPTDIVPDKARTMLGYTGPVPRAEAMARTLDWARHARILRP